MLFVRARRYQMIPFGIFTFMIVMNIIQIMGLTQIQIWNNQFNYVSIVDYDREVILTSISARKNPYLDLHNYL